MLDKGVTMLREDDYQLEQAIIRRRGNLECPIHPQSCRAPRAADVGQNDLHDYSPSWIDCESTSQSAGRREIHPPRNRSALSWHCLNGVYSVQEFKVR